MVKMLSAWADIIQLRVHKLQLKNTAVLLGVQEGLWQQRGAECWGRW